MTGEDGMRLLLKREGRVTKEGDGAAELSQSEVGLTVTVLVTWVT